MQKTAKITRAIFKNEWPSPNGKKVYYHEIELDNGDKGQIGTLDKEPSKLNPGQTLTYTIEQTDKGYKIKAVQEQRPFGGGGKQQQDPKIQMISFAMSYTKDLVIGDKVKLDQMSQYFDKIYSAMLSKLPQ